MLKVVAVLILTLKCLWQIRHHSHKKTITQWYFRLCSIDLKCVSGLTVLVMFIKLWHQRFSQSFQGWSELQYGCLLIASHLGFRVHQPISGKEDRTVFQYKGKATSMAVMTLGLFKGKVEVSMAKSVWGFPSPASTIQL